MPPKTSREVAFCKTFPDSSHVTVLWNPRTGAHIETPDDLWSLPHDMASEFLRRVAEGRPTEADRQILDDCAASASIAAVFAPAKE